ncbi:MAG: T9SS type A sorting domain-containing protein [Bacteroidia bacterium]
MKKTNLSALILLLPVIAFNSASAQCICTAGELTGLNVNKDGECSSDPNTGYQNHVNIEILRAQLKTGTIQWSFLPDNGSGTWTSLPGGWTGTENLDHLFFTVAENGSYRCIFTETTTSCRDTVVAYISVAPQPNIHVTTDSSTCDGMWFSVHDNNNPSGTGNSYCWQFDGTNCQSGNSSFLFATAGCTMGNNHVNIIVSNFAGCSDEAHLTGICNPDLLDVFIELSGSEYLCRGEKSSVLSVKRHSAISFPANWQYQWRRNGSAIPGATSADYIPANSGVFTCKVISGSGCQKITNPISITFFPLVVAEITAASNEICTGDSVLLQVSSGNAIQFEWYRNGISTGVTGSEFFAKRQGNYKVLATSIEGCTKYSNVLHPIVFTATIQANGNQNLCNGDSVMLTASCNGNAGSFQWFRYNNPISGASGSSLFAKKAGRYRVVAVSSDNCTDTSNSIYITSICRESSTLSETSFSIQPNPAGNYIDLIFSDNMDSHSGNLTITNSMGQIVFQTNLMISSPGSVRITLPQSLKSGYYFVLVRQDGKTNCRKLLINE